MGAVVPLTSNPNQLMEAITNVIPGDLIGIVRNTALNELRGHIIYG